MENIVLSKEFIKEFQTIYIKKRNDKVDEIINIIKKEKNKDNKKKP